MLEPRIDLIPQARLLVGDEDVTDPSGGTCDHYYAATGKVVGQVPLAGAAEVDGAVKLARAAAQEWHSSPVMRRQVMLKMASVIRQNAAELAQLAIIDNSFPIASAEVEYHSTADFLEYNAGWADKITGEVIPTLKRPALDYAQQEPYGVVGVIAPWNGPVNVFGIVGGPALAAGNCVVMKVPEVTPYASVRVAELFREAGFPPGVVTFLTGGPEAGQAMTRHPGIDKIHFTGSPATARDVLAKAAENITPCALELGGKSANIIFEDADLATAVPMAMAQVIARSGQGCIRGTRLLVQERIYEDVVEACVEIADKARLGDPLEHGAEMGPVISASAKDRIEGMIKAAAADGAGRVVAGGMRCDGELGDGYYVRPTVIADVEPSSVIAQQEVFGPVLCVMPFRSTDDAVALANNTQYALAAYIQTNDLTRAHTVANRLVSGNVWVNGFDGIMETAPFGGAKASGFGRQGGYYGIQEFIRPKNVWIGLR
jgi:aldehyde dehydrogenase (NAD+)